MTYDPVTIIERPKTGLFKGLPSAGPGTVLVVDREGNPLRVLAGAGDRLTAGEVRWGQIRTLFEVDVTEHPLQFSEVFPCRDDIGGFRAEVMLDCTVTDPAAVVRRGIRDVADQQQELELTRAANRNLKEQQSSGSLELERLKFERERQRMQAELDEERLALERRRAELQGELDMQLLQDKLRRHQIQVGQLTTMLGGGQVAALAMQVVEDPAAIGRVSAYLASQRTADINRQMEALKLLLESDSLEGWQITEQAKEVLTHLLNAWSSEGRGVGANGRPEELEASPVGDPLTALPEADSGVFPPDLEASE